MSSPKRPEGVNDFQNYMLSRLDQVYNQVADVRVEVGQLRGRARAWGAVPGTVAVLISLAALLLGLK
ncbi:MAG: hypothetical protein V3S55_15960 [Nitrospiraceae bacterium]